MAKANEFVVDALEDIVVQADEAPIEPSEGRAALRVLNDMMAMWAVQGVNLGYTTLSDLGQEVTVPDGAKIAIKAHLAIMLASKYEVPVTPELKLKADLGWKAVMALSVDTAESAFPPTLPMGSGNTDGSNVVFFGDEQGTILTETGGAIALEEDTEEAS